MPEIRTLSTATLGRYLVDPAGPGAPLLVGFHGYGQHAGHLLEELQRIPGSRRWTRVSVQALHPFYNPKTREVVASWMTSQDREQAIEDNLAYVGRVLTELRAAHGHGRLVFAGFSQGAAMAWRAAARFPCKGLLALGGDLPRDVTEASHLVLPPMLLGRGERDAFYSADHLVKDLSLLQAYGFHPETLTFDGGHEWGPEFLEAAGRFLDRVTL
ncbi:MAG TPA: hypothetical protein VJ623_15140 [Holophagaceae bacterium]|nr:hypothetical protein [Holophagaceae bacterium]